MSRAQRSFQPWRIHFFQRHPSDDAGCAVPVIEFFDELSDTVVAQIQAVLDAVAGAPPPSFSGGGKWEAMKGDMAGFFEVRVTGNNKAGKRMNHRLFCVLIRDDPTLGGSAIVCIGGLSKEPREAARPSDYKRIRQLRDEFMIRRSVLK
jgi:hypothetical protein